MEKLLRKNNIIIAVLFLIAAGAIASSVYFYVQNKKTQQLLKNPTLSAQAEIENLMSKVGNLMELPKNEQPTIATVTDVTKLKDQSFFSKAKNGDKLLIYTKERKAILYDPTTDKIVEAGPVNIGQPTPTQAPLPMKVAIYNGTTTVGLSNTTEQQLKAQLNNITVTAKQNASKTTYTKTMVIDLTGTQSAAATQLAQILGGEVSTLPAGETKPKDADILVILGK